MTQRCDVSQEEEVISAVALAQAEFGSVDILINNAGKALNKLATETSVEKWDSMMTNAFGPARLAQHLLPMLKPDGSLVFMSSHRGSIAANTEPGIGLELYRASKAALNMLARCIYMDISQGAQTVLSIHPGWAATAMGTLDGTVNAEIDVRTSVNGMVSVIEQHRNARSHLFLDYENNSWP
ncbi:SDR family oxidoreductase [Kosakonia sp. MUSA4]|uniref:SDR family oxidoreductase n=1 Tax=Kosakonia sp. MUSA4 TaxID=2067958 RepID=UPI0020983577